MFLFRYMVNMHIMDNTSSTWVVMFDADSLFRMTAEELELKKKRNEQEFLNIISDLVFTQMKFSISVKVSNYRVSPIYAHIFKETVGT